MSKFLRGKRGKDVQRFNLSNLFELDFGPLATVSSWHPGTSLVTNQLRNGKDDILILPLILCYLFK